MTYTPTEVFGLITAEIPSQYTVHAECEPTWLDANPGGFAPMEDDATKIVICPERITELAEEFTAEQTDQFLHAIADYVVSTADAMQEQCSTLEVLGIFLTRAPDAAFFMVTMARRLGITVAEFLGLPHDDSFDLPSDDSFG